MKRRMHSCAIRFAGALVLLLSIQNAIPATIGNRVAIVISIDGSSSVHQLSPKDAARVKQMDILLEGTQLRVDSGSSIVIAHNQASITYTVKGPADIEVTRNSIIAIPDSAIVARSGSTPPAELMASGSGSLQRGRTNEQTGGEDLGTSRAGLGTDSFVPNAESSVDKQSSQFSGLFYQLAGLGAVALLLTFLVYRYSVRFISPLLSASNQTKFAFAGISAVILTIGIWELASHDAPKTYHASSVVAESKGASSIQTSSESGEPIVNAVPPSIEQETKEAPSYGRPEIVPSEIGPTVRIPAEHQAEKTQKEYQRSLGMGAQNRNELRANHQRAELGQQALQNRQQMKQNRQNENRQQQMQQNRLQNRAQTEESREIAEVDQFEKRWHSSPGARAAMKLLVSTTPSDERNLRKGFLILDILRNHDEAKKGARLVIDSVGDAYPSSDSQQYLETLHSLLRSETSQSLQTLELLSDSGYGPASALLAEIYSNGLPAVGKDPQAAAKYSSRTTAQLEAAKRATFGTPR